MNPTAPLMIILGGLVPSPAPLLGQTEYTTDGVTTSLEEEIRWHVNRGRYDSARENQLRNTSYTDIPATAGPLAPHQSLTLAARRHSEDMARNGVMQHATVPGSSYYDAVTQPTPWDRFRAEGYSYSGAGENIAAGYGSAEAAYVGWWKSTGHRLNMFNAGHREIGNGQFQWVGTNFRPYYTMKLGSRGGNHFFTDTIFRDVNANRAYNQGEGVAGIPLRLRLPTTGHSSFDLSSSSGSFAIPISMINAGSKVEIWLENPSATPVLVTIPRNFDNHDTIPVGPGGQVLAGHFMKPTSGRNLGFRDLIVTEPSVSVPELAVSRSGDVTELRWTTEAGAGYLPQWSDDLVRWTDLVPALLTGTGGDLTHHHTTSSGLGFYRIKFEPAM